MRKPKAKSAFYFRYPEIMSLEDRLDYSYWHPKFENLIALLASSKFIVKELSCVVRSPIVSGKTPENYIYPTKGVLFIGSRNVRNGKIDLSDVTYVDETIHNGFLRSSKVSAGDILVTMAGAIGRCAMYTDQEKEANINQAVARLQSNGEEVNPQYLVYYLNSSFGQLQFDRNRHDVNQPNINTTEIGRIKVICPKKGLQNEIVSQLSTIENEIALLTDRQQIVLQKLRSVILSELELVTPSVKCDYYIRAFEILGERLDFIWNHPTTHSVKQYLELQHVIPLDDLVEDEIEYGINAYGKVKGKIPFVNVENLDLDGLIHLKGIRYLNEAPKSKILKENDILISRSRTVGTCGLVTKREEGYTFGSYILRFRVNPTTKIKPLYVASFINSELGQAQIKYLQTGSREAKRGGGNNINPNQLKQLMIILSKTPEQQTTIVRKTKESLRKKEEIDLQLREKIINHNNAFEKFFATLENRIEV